MSNLVVIRFDSHRDQEPFPWSCPKPTRCRARLAGPAQEHRPTWSVAGHRLVPAGQCGASAPDLVRRDDAPDGRVAPGAGNGQEARGGAPGAARLTRHRPTIPLFCDLMAYGKRFALGRAAHFGRPAGDGRLGDQVALELRALGLDERSALRRRQWPGPPARWVMPVRRTSELALISALPGN